MMVMNRRVASSDTTDGADGKCQTRRGVNKLERRKMNNWEVVEDGMESTTGH